MSRREKLEKMLVADPDDPFLHYALAKEEISAGEPAAGVQRLTGVIERFPDYVPAYFQKAQTAAELGEIETARQTVTAGIAVARRVGDRHAESEMSGFLDSLP